MRKRSTCVGGTRDADIVDDLKPAAADNIVIKKRDSAFQVSEIGVWLKSLAVDALIFCGIDKSICVETSLRDDFNNDFDIILVSDALPRATANTLNPRLRWLGNITAFSWSLQCLRDACHKSRRKRPEPKRDFKNQRLVRFRMAVRS
ncbi:isochorismatase family cysteine hydrolase [Nitrososphaera sp.]|uniref:isochorismatase family cysteine hydrolase n=1 Tax=Nitrososphaera sp. TaxID=1971748 RepID=UPI0039C932DB